MEQCDLYYECIDGKSTPNLCPDGLMFDDTSTIESKCDYPFNVECGARQFVREYIQTIILILNTLQYIIFDAEKPEEGVDPKCYRANGFFNHEADDECNK